MNRPSIFDAEGTLIPEPRAADLRGLVPGITGGLSSEEYVRSIRDAHEHDWKDAPDWVVERGMKAQECFPCRGLRIVSALR